MHEAPVRGRGLRVVVRDTGIEPVTSSVSGKRSPAELIARDPVTGDEVETGIEPVCTALQAVASPLGHSTVVTRTPARENRGTRYPRADDGIRTRDPNLGKVVRYQLRHVRTLLGGVSASVVRFETLAHVGRKSQIRCSHRVSLPSLLSRPPQGRSAAAVAGAGRGPCWEHPRGRVNVSPRSDGVLARGPVPWLSGRASRSHREGRWFDPSRDHREDDRPSLQRGPFAVPRPVSPGMVTW